MLIFVEIFTNFVLIMKKIFIAALSAILFAGSAQAEGYQINTLSAKQLGMGHTGVAQKLGSESMFFNPAGMAFSDKTLDISGSLTGIKAIGNCTVDGKTYKTDNGLSTPMMLNLGFKVYDKMQAGVSFYTPYGSGIDWTEAWPGAVLSQNVSLKVFCVQPTVAYRLLDNLSIGAGLMIAWGEVDLNKGLMPGTNFGLGDMPPASVNLKGTSQVAIGFNAGAMWDVTKQLTLGVNFRSRMSMKVNAGVASVSYANSQIEAALENQLGLINQANFSAMMPCPYVWNFGATYRPTEQWTVAADFQLTGWHTYRYLNVNFPGPLAAFDQTSEKNYKNAWCYRFGAKYAATDRFDLRAGLMIDTSPVDKDHYNPETPSMTKLEPTVGFSFRPIDRLSIDFAFMYVHGLGVDNASCSYDDLALKMAGAPEAAYHKTFTADYKVHAFIPSVGLSFKF